MRAIYSKFKRVAGEIALLLQSLHKAFYFLADDCESNQNLTLEPQFMAMGIKLAKRYLDEIKAIYLRNEGSRENNLSPMYSRIINLSQRKGWLKARDLKQSDRYFRKLSTVDIRRHFQDLVSLGFGFVRGIGKHLEWCFIQKVDIDDNQVDANVDGTINTQSYSYGYVSASKPATVDNQSVDKSQNIESPPVNTNQIVDAGNNSENRSLIDSERNTNQSSTNQKEYSSKNEENLPDQTKNKYEGLYAIVPKQYSPSGILVDLREEKGFILGRQSGLRKTIKIPISQVIEYRNIS